MSSKEITIMSPKEITIMSSKEITIMSSKEITIMSSKEITIMSSKEITIMSSKELKKNNKKTKKQKTFDYVENTLFIALNFVSHDLYHTLYTLFNVFKCIRHNKPIRVGYRITYT